MAVSAVYLSLLEVALLAAAAEGLAEYMSRYGVPQLVSAMLIGLALSPYSLGGIINGLLRLQLFSVTPYVTFMADLSVALLIFGAGVERGLSALRSAGALGALGATFGALAPFLLVATLLANAVGRAQAMMAGAALAATSLAAVTALVNELRIRGRREVDFLEFAGAFDDVVALIIFTVATVAAEGGRLGPGGLALLALKYVAAWGVITAASVVLVPRLMRAFRGRELRASLAVLFAIIAVMEYVGLSPIVGAYVAGVAVGESCGAREVGERLSGLTEALGAIFFAYSGLLVDVRVLGLAYLGLGLALTAIGLLGKVVGVMPFAYAYSRDLRGTALVSLGMVPRGEVGLAIAAEALEYGLISAEVYGSTVIAVILLTVIGAVAFRRAALSVWLRPRAAPAGTPRAAAPS